MQWQQLVTDIFERISQELEHALDETDGSFGYLVLIPLTSVLSMIYILFRS